MECLFFKNHKVSTVIFSAGLILFLTILFSAADDVTPQIPDRIEFITGDQLQGKLRQFKSPSNVEFYSSILQTNLLVKSDGIYKLCFGSVNHPTNLASGNCIIRLVNDDTFTANFSVLENDVVTADTWFCGKVKIPRSRIKSITPSAGAGLIYDGPRSLDGWTVYNPGFFANVIIAGGRQGMVPVQQQPQSPWFYTNNAFYNNGQGAIGRYFQLPEKTSIDFDLEWRGNLALSVFFCSETLAPYTGRSYMMLFTYRGAYLHRRGTPTGITVLGQTEILEFAKNTKARVSIKVDKEQKNIALFINGIFQKVWKDEGDFIGDGNGILFNQQSSARIKISNIKISRWDGGVESADSVDSKSTNDVVRLANKDIIEGRVSAISNQILNIKTGYGSLDIPLERVIRIEFATLNKQVADENLVRGYLSDFGTISFKIEEISRDKIIGFLPDTGRLVFSPSSFTMLQFKPDSERTVENEGNAFDNFDDLFE
ncbi:MAG: hypothetical protein ACP5T0_09400 [Verrucomicrobiia bacterium]